MKCLRPLLVLALLLSGAVAAPAASPSERYIQVYNVIQEADALVVRNEARAALQRYNEALGLLRALQAAEPAWNTGMVSYRMGYLTEQIKKLNEKLGGAASASTNAPAPATAPGEVVKSLQEEIARLNNDNATLQAKLKEALSVQPATSDPRELAKAQDQIKALLKERDLLRVSTEQLRDSSRTASAASEADKRALADVQKQVAQQAALAASLKEQNDLLQRQVNQARPAGAPAMAAPPGSDVDARLKTAQQEIATLQASNARLTADLATHQASPGSGKELEKQLAKANDSLRAAESERDTLSRKLADAQRELKAKLPVDTATKMDDLNRQLIVARARLEAYEARPVPFTPEEQALFKHAPTKMVATAETNVVKRKPAELPRGAAPLFNEAQRAIDAKRFEDAESKLQQVLSQDENNIYVLANLAGVQLDMNKPAEAEKHLTKALSLDPRDPACLYLMGSLKLSQEKYDEALDALSQAAQLTPDNGMAQYNLGRALVFKGNSKAAETAFRTAIKLKPNWPDAHYQLAVIYATGNPSYRELAQWHYQKAINGGMARNFELERRLEKNGSAKP